MSLSKEQFLNIRSAFEALDTFSHHLLLNAFQKMGVLNTPGEVYEIDSLFNKLGILPVYSQLWGTLLKMLEKAGFIQIIGNVEIVALPGCANPELSIGNWLEKADMLEQKYPILKKRLSLLYACLEDYPAILKGNLAYEKVLFSEGLEKGLDDLFEDDPLSASYRALLAHQLRQTVLKRRSNKQDKPLVIVEMGAAPANKSELVLDALSDLSEDVLYFWTDADSRMCDLAESKLARKYPFVQFRQWDIEKPVDEWEFDENSIDILIGCNSFSRTKHIEHTLGQTKRILKPHGILLLNEATRKDDFTALTLGLDPAWWRLEDPGERIPGSPLLKSAQWKSLLIGHGFGPVRIYHLKEDDHDAPSQLILSGECGNKKGEVIMVKAPEKLKDTPPHLRKPAYSEKSIVDFDPQKLELGKKEFSSEPVKRKSKAKRKSDAMDPDIIPLVDDTELEATAPPSELDRIGVDVKEPIAVIGISGAYPMAPDVSAFWDLLRQGRSAFQEIPLERITEESKREELLKHHQSTHRNLGGFLADIDKFDPYLFKIEPAQADALYPQERLLLESVWASLENAGYTRSRFQQIEQQAGLSVGVFIGCSTSQLMPFKPEEVTVSAPLGGGSIANKVAHFFGFNGPSMVVDNDETSSLAAIHLAVQSLQRGECASAMVGGVYVDLNLAAKITNGGHQHDANTTLPEESFIDGEGVGAILLKPLSEAKRSGDRVLGVIRASGMQTLSASQVEDSVYARLNQVFYQRLFEQSGMTAEEISYLEVNGIGGGGEAAANVCTLADLFQDNTHPIPIGDVGGNIGDLKSALGISQLTKVLYQMRHRALVPCNNAKMAYPKIDLEETPFVIQNKLLDWKLPETGLAHDAKLRKSMISSFGKKGGQVHLLLEEYLNPAVDSEKQDDPSKLDKEYLIVLSARNKDRLQDMARNLVTYLNRLSLGSQPTLEALAFTLQLGREVMDERAAFIVKDIETLLILLEKYSSGVEAIPHAHFGNVENGFSDHNFLLSGESGKTFLRKLIAEKEWGRLAYLWVTGADIPWLDLYENPAILPVALPNYPFAKISCYVPNSSQDEIAIEDTVGRDTAPDSISAFRDGVGRKLSRMPFPVSSSRIEGASTIQSNESFNQQGEHLLIGRLDPALSQEHTGGAVFRKMVKPLEAFVDSKRMPGFHVVPGVVFLEMALAGLNEVCGREGMELNQVVWMQPLVVPEAGIEVRTLIKETIDGLQYTIESGSLDSSIILGKGQFIESKQAYGKRESKLSLRNIQDEYARIWNSEDLYRKFEDLGLTFSNYYKSVQLFWLWDEEAVGRLELPEAIHGTESQYLLNPSLIDGAMQIAAGMVLLSGGEALIPFSVENIKVFEQLPHKCYVLVRRQENQRFNLSIMDENWSVCAEFTAFTMCLPKGESENIYYRPVWEHFSRADWSSAQRKEHCSHLLLYTPEARDMTLALQGAILENGGEVASFPLINGDDSPPDFRTLLAPLEHVDRVYYLGITDTCPERAKGRVLPEKKRFSYLLSLLHFFEVLDEKGFHHDMFIKIVTNESVGFPRDAWVNSEGAALGGLGIAEGKSHALWRVTCVDISLNEWLDGNQEDITRMILGLKTEHEHSAGTLAYRHGKCYRKTLVPSLLNPVQMSTFRYKGVYLVLGGGGGISAELCRYLANNYQARIILLGWPPADAAFEQLIEEIRYFKGDAEYWSVDATDSESVHRAFTEAKERFGQIHGAFHSGFSFQDSIFNRIDEDVFTDILRSTVDVSLVLGDVLKDEKLDFLVFFSSFQSFATIAGQGSYASASLAMDGCALGLGLNVNFPIKVINWGHWESEGGQFSSDYRRFLLQQGIFTIEIDECMNAIEHVLDQAGNVQYAVTKISPEFEGKLGVARYKQWCSHANISQHPLAQAIELNVTEHVLNAEKLTDDEVHPVAFANEVLDDLGASCLMDAFQIMGIFRSSNEKYAVGVLRENLRITPAYEAFLPAMLDVLVKAGYLEIEAGRYKATSQVQMNLRKYLRGKIEHRIKAIRETNPGFKTYVALLEQCTSAISQAVRGTGKVDELLFADGVQSLLQKVYRKTPITDYYDRTFVATVKDVVAQGVPTLKERETFTIMELGASSSHLSSAFFKTLAPFAEKIIYYYTDSKERLETGRKKEFLSRYTFVEFRELDIEFDSIQQGFAPGSVDLVIAGSHLHTTRNIQRTLENIKKLLKTAGILLLNEITEARDYVTLTMGLSIDWWQFDDESIRIPYSPFLSKENWTDQLLLAGYYNVSVNTLPEHIQDTAGQNQFLALSDGNFIEQKQVEYSEGVDEGSDSKTTKKQTRMSFQSTHSKNTSWADGGKSAVLSVVSVVLNIGRESIDINKPLEEYITSKEQADEITRHLENRFGPLPSTLLFEYPTLSDLFSYLEKAFTTK